MPVAGFIGFHLARLLMSEGYEVHGFNAITHYYDVRLTKRHHHMLLHNPRFSKIEAYLEDNDAL